MFGAKVQGGSKVDGVLKSIGTQLPKDAYVAVGFLQSQTNKRSGVPVASAAYWNEYGTASQPARPFFRPMIKAKSAQWGEQVVQLVRAGMVGSAILNTMGAVIAADLKESIRDSVVQPLSPITLMLRKMRDENPNLVMSGRVVAEAARRVAAGEEGASGMRAKPLEDTFAMLQAPAYEVHL